MSGIGYKAFKISSKDVNEFGQIQDKLTTIEFGFSPFIPFSRLYEMVVSEQIAEGFDRGAAGGRVKEDTKKEAESWIMAPGNDKPPKQSWLAQLQQWREANYDLETLVDKRPDGEMRQEANTLSKWISQLLENEQITSVYEGSVAGEIMEQSLVTAALDVMGRESGKWKHKNFEPASKVIKKLTQGEGYSREQVDLTYISDFARPILDYTLHRMAAQFGEDFVKGSIGVETTDMITHKTFQHSLFEQHGDLDTYTEEQVKTAIEADIEKIMSLIQGVNGNLKDVYDELTRQGNVIKALKKDKSYSGPALPSGDSFEYTAAQILDRMRKIEASWWEEGNEGDPTFTNYHYQYPISQFQNVYARLEPEFTGTGDSLRLTNIDVKTKIVDYSGLPAWLTDLMSKPSSYRSYVSLHSNFILLDAFTNLKLKQFQIEQIAKAGFTDTVNHLAVNIGKAGELLGTSLETETALVPLTMIGQAPVVSTVEILSSKEVANSLKAQILGHYQGASQQIAGWYGDAMTASSNLTTSWKANTSKTPDIWGEPYNTEKDLSGVGIPFFMTMGRDVTAYNLFRNKVADRSTWERNGFFDPASRVLYAPGAMKRSGEFNVSRDMSTKFAQAGIKGVAFQGQGLGSRYTKKDARKQPKAMRQAFMPSVPRFLSI